jgi:hypothetical protein
LRPARHLNRACHMAAQAAAARALRAKSRLHYTLFITTLIIWNKTRASAIWTLTFIVGTFVNNAFSFTLRTGFHS